VLERDEQARTRVIPSVTAKNIGKFLAENVSKDATINTDEHSAYKLALKGQKRHDSVCHIPTHCSCNARGRICYL